MAKLMASMILGACVLAGGNALAGGYAKFVDITVDKLENVAAENCPVLVRVTAAKVPGFYADVQHAGADVKFTDLTGKTAYPHEIDTWDPSGESLFWVKVPSLRNGEKFRMYYSNPSVSVVAPSTGLWSGYVAVWHLNGTASEADSTANGYVGVAVNTAGAAEGHVGKSHRINTTTDARSTVGAIKIANSANLAFGESFTVSGWVKANSGTHGPEAIFAKKNADVWGKDGGFALYTASWDSYCGKAMMCSVGQGQGTQLNVRTDSEKDKCYGDGNWHHLAISYVGGTTIKVHLDGKISSETTTEALVPTANAELFVLGGPSDANESVIGTSQTEKTIAAFKGMMDEFRISLGSRETSDINAECQAAGDVLTFDAPVTDDAEATSAVMLF